MYETIRYEPEDGWVSIVLDRPAQKNALSGKMMRELEAALWEADDDRSVHVVLISGEGDSFCAGYDLIEYREKDESGKRPGVKRRGARSYDDDVWQLEKNQRRLLTAFDMHKPVVAKVHGNCIAGGIDLALACDMIIAAHDARIGFPPARSQGTLPLNFWTYHVSPQWAKRLLLTGDFISGKDAARIGLILKSVPRGRLDAEALHLVNRMRLIDPEVLAVNKRVVNLAQELMGARTMQRLAAELDARGHLAKGAREFGAAVMEKGIREAVRMRDEPFGTDVARVEEPDVGE
jgi:enoyl-CoA hydratase